MLVLEITIIFRPVYVSRSHISFTLGWPTVTA